MGATVSSRLSNTATRCRPTALAKEKSDHTQEPLFRSVGFFQLKSVDRLGCSAKTLLKDGGGRSVLLEEHVEAHRGLSQVFGSRLRPIPTLCTW
ncbi:hypothetical protein M3Y99_01015300 [Aphelenchoides fujianensis]|nr:hypothetical protein M3Y99_01015300 [Aphelenchoides fujianensis]